MSMNDPVADFLTHIRNAMMRNHENVESPCNRLKKEIAEVLKKEGFIHNFVTHSNERGHQRITLQLKYDNHGKSVIRGIQRVSTPGLRRYVGYHNINPVLNGQGIAIISTSKGIMTDMECREKKAGGEVLCHVW